MRINTAHMAPGQIAGSLCSTCRETGRLTCPTPEACQLAEPSAPLRDRIAAAAEKANRWLGTRNVFWWMAIGSALAINGYALWQALR
jgi:hypothetical protein